MKTILVIALMLSSAAANAYCLNGHEIEGGAGTVTINGKKSGDIQIDHGLSEKCLRLQLGEEAAIQALNEGNRGGTVVELEPTKPAKSSEPSNPVGSVFNFLDDAAFNGAVGDLLGD